MLSVRDVSNGCLMVDQKFRVVKLNREVMKHFIPFVKIKVDTP